MSAVYLCVVYVSLHQLLFHLVSLRCDTISAPERECRTPKKSDWRPRTTSCARDPPSAPSEWKTLGTVSGTPKLSTYVQDWTQVLFSKYFIFCRVFDIFIFLHIWQNCVCVLVTFYQWGHFVTLIIRNLNLINVQSRAYLRLSQKNWTRRLCFDGPIRAGYGKISK